MAVPSLNWGNPDPNLVLAAEAGDVGAMKALGEHRYDARGQELGERWVRAAAETGDPEAMYCLSEVYRERAQWHFIKRRHQNCDAEEAGSADWCRRAAQAGWPKAMRAMGAKSGISAKEREFWLRRAVEGGDRWAMADLADLAQERE